MIDDASGYIIAKIRKNASEEIHVAHTEYKGQQLVDVRVFADINGAMTATRKGICCSIGRISAIIEALEDAQTEAVRRGLLLPEPAPPAADETQQPATLAVGA